MRTISKIFAVILAIIAAVAFYGAAFCNANWHYATAIACTILGLLFFADSQTPNKTSLQ